MAKPTIADLQQKIAELEEALRGSHELKREVEVQARTQAAAAEDRHKTAIAELQKSVESSKTMEKWASERATKAEAELDNAHSLIDAIDCPLPRKSKGEYSEISNPLVLRLGSWLARKAGMGAQ